MAHKEDLRVIKTKAALTHTFFEMLKEIDVDDITVNELCIRANVRRATFYKHFKDKIDFLTYIIRDIRDTFDKENITDAKCSNITLDYYVNYISAIGKFLSERRDAISKILRSSLGPIFTYTFMQQNYYDTIDKLEQSVKDGMVLPTSIPVVASMLIGGISHNILRWFELDNHSTLDDLLIEMIKYIRMILK